MCEGAIICNQVVHTSNQGVPSLGVPHATPSAAGVSKDRGSTRRGLPIEQCELIRVPMCAQSYGSSCPSWALTSCPKVLVLKHSSCDPQVLPMTQNGANLLLFEFFCA